MLIEDFKWDVDFPEDLKGDDSKIEKLWDSLTDVLLDENECLVSDWELWKAGTNKEEIEKVLEESPECKITCIVL